MDYTKDIIIRTKAEAVTYLSRDGNLRVPCSRYGIDTRECAAVAWLVAKFVADESGTTITTCDLDYAMSLVVNDSRDLVNGR